MSLRAAFIVPHPPLAVPEIGRGEERQIQDTLDAYHEVGRQIGKLNPDTIVILSPHTSYYADWLHISPGSRGSGTFMQFRAPDVGATITYDTTFREELIAEAHAHHIPAGTQGEVSKALDHGVLVPLYFIGQHVNLDNIKFVRVGGAAIDRTQLAEFGRLIAATAERLGKDTVLVASGDLSHKLTPDGPYGFDAAGPVFDKAFGEIVTSGKVDKFLSLDPAMCSDAAECGLSGFCVLAGALSQFTFTSKLLSLEGPFGVGYGVATFTDLQRKEDTDAAGAENANAAAASTEHHDPVVALAWETITSWITEHKRPPKADRKLPDTLPERAGAFVSLHLKDTDELRGCIGTIAPTQRTLGDEIVENAISAATRDPRFYPVQPDELDNLTISVDILREPERATKAMLDPKKYGVIVTAWDGRRGLLLPNLDGVDTVYQQLSIACRKAGIDYGHEEFDIERFEVERHY